jgi:hypothetical protein
LCSHEVFHDPREKLESAGCNELPALSWGLRDKSEPRPGVFVTSPGFRGKFEKGLSDLRAVQRHFRFDFSINGLESGKSELQRHSNVGSTRYRFL